MAGSEKNVLIKILGDDAAFQKTIKKVYKTADSLKGLNDKINAGLAALGVGASVKYVLDQNEQAQQSYALLESQVKATGDAAGLTVKQMTEIADKAQQTTIFDDDTVRQAEAQMLAFTNITGEQFKKTLAVALDFATVTGRNLPDAVRTLGEAINNPISSMGRLTQAGISLDTATKNHIQTLQQEGKLTEAQNFLIQKLEQSYGGAAVAARQTLGGALKGLINDFGDAMKIGEGAASDTADLTQAINDLDKELQDPQIKAGLQSIIGGLITLVGWAIKGAAAIAEIGKGLGIAFAQNTGAKGPEGSAEYAEAALKDAQARVKALQAGIADKQDQRDNGGWIGKWLTGSSDSLKKKLAEAQAQVNLWQRTLDGINKLPPGAQNRASGEGGTAPSGNKGTVSAGAQSALDAATVALARLKAIDAAGLAALDQQMQEHKVSIQQYYAAKLKAAQAEIDAEIRLDKEKLNNTQITASQRAQIEGQIIALEQKRKQVGIEAATAQAKAEKQLADQLQGVKDALAQAEGKTSEAGAGQIKKQYADLLAQLKAENDTAGVELVEKLINVKEAQAQLNELMQRYQETVSAMQGREQEIQAQQNAGLLTQEQGQQEIVSLHKETAQIVGGMLPQLQQLSDTIGNPQTAASVERVKEQYKQLSIVTDQYLTQIQGAGANALTGFFDNILTGAKSARGAFDDMAQSFAQALAQMEAQILASQVLTAFMNYFRGGSTTQSSFQNSPYPAAYHGGVGAADGGLIRGPGTATSDSIPTRLSDGEFVVKAASVRQYGVRLLDSINRGLFPALSGVMASRVGGSHFAEGGLVAGGGNVEVNVINQSGQPAQVAEKTGPGGQRQVNVLIGQAAAHDVMTNGPLGKAIEQRYGLRLRSAQRG